MNFNEKLEILIEDGASDFEISKLLREEIKEYLNSLNKTYDKNHGKHFLVAHTKKIEYFIILIYKYVLRDSFGIYRPTANAIPISLIALGSFGREQLCIYSDLDLMIVYKDNKGYNLKPIIERVLYVAWDAGLKLGHRVHELNDIFNSSKKDITIKTAMLESRFIYGSKILWMEVETRLTQVRKFKQKEFVELKLEENKKRLSKYFLTNEPQIKDGYGALREDNTLLWICKAYYGVYFIKDLIGNIIKEDEYREFRSSLEFLFRLRVAIHLVAKKKKDQLTFDIQHEVAQKLGFKNTKTRTAERLLLKKTFESMLTNHTFSHLYTSKIIQIKNSDFFKNFNKLEGGMYSQKEKLYFDYRALSLKIVIILKNILNNKIKEYDDSTIVLFKNAIFPNNLNLELKNIINKIFLFKFASHLFKIMYRSGVLVKLIPPFKSIIGLAQFDGYHKMPVGLHSINSIYHLENIRDINVLKIYNLLSQKDKALLKFVTLFHDIGKGRVREHGAVGANIFKTFAHKLKIEENQIQKGIILIKHHTLLSHISLKDDIYSQRIVFDFITTIKTKEILDMLYVLTYADINGVSPSAYSSFNAKLIYTLHSRASLIIDKKEQIDEATIRKRKERLLLKTDEFLLFSKMVQKSVLNLENSLFFIKHNNRQIVDIINRALKVKKIDILIFNKGHLSIEIMSKMPINLGWLLSQFSYMNLTSLEIYRFIQDINYFKIEFEQKIEDSNNIDLIVKNALDMNKKFYTKKVKLKKEEVELNLEHSLSYASISITTKDQKGLMAFVMNIFDEEDIEVLAVKISTHANKVKDLFLINKSQKLINRAKNIKKKLISDII